MAKTTSQPLTQNTKNPSATIVNATSFTAANPGTAPTNTILFATAGADDSIIRAIMISSNDTAAATVQFWLSPDAGTTKYLIGSVVVAALSGNATLINIDVLGNAIITGMSADQAGKPILLLQATYRIYVGVITAAVTANKNVYIIGIQEDY